MPKSTLDRLGLRRKPEFRVRILVVEAVEKVLVEG